MLSLQWCPGTTRENVSPVKKKRTGTPSPSISPSPNILAPPPASAPPAASARPAAPTPTSPPASPAAPKSASSDGETWFFNCRCGEKGWGLDDGTAQWQCEKCHSWQHERCVSIGGGGVPSPYLCHECAPVAAPKACGGPVARDAEASSILAGKSQSNRDKVMVVLEKCAAGLGVGAVAWPQPFLCDAELPMTLGADVEMLKYCGKRLECAHGADISNGWAYSHAFGKLKAYQTALLGEAAFDAPPLSELDDDAVEALVPDHIKTVCAARP
ncbi:exodeoxyribonuclease III [Aureococcus anophagefferens]|nr:exodeoxyribonuclease III [Aureococcus anophagefferens]